MSKVYDSWERLVAAILNREQLRHLALCESFDTSISADFSFDDETFTAEHIEFEELKKATKNFRPYSVLGEGAFGHFSKGWIDENTLTASEPGFGTPVTVEKWIDETTASRISSNSISRRPNSIQAEHIEFEELKKATRNFRSYCFQKDLGEGWLGHFSKGWIDENTLTASKPGFGTPVAVKKWSAGGHQAIKECFLKEINYLSLFRHPNIVKLIGYCSKENYMILVYEFIPEGSLDRHLFPGSHDQTLPWVTRIKVAVGAARALAFLHDNENQIVHRNFNTADILLDGEFNAKLCNFGLAMKGPMGNRTEVMGTCGYAAPESFATGRRLTTKYDVYSFGVVLVELLTGRKSVDGNSWPISEYNLVHWATPYLRRSITLSRIMDPKLEGQFPHKAAFAVATIAMQCLRQIPEQRPSMAKVLVSLEQLSGSKTV